MIKITFTSPTDRHKPLVAKKVKEFLEREFAANVIYDIDYAKAGEMPVLYVDVPETYWDASK